MCITEYDEERTFAEFQEEAREEGRAEGRAEGREEGALKKLIELVNIGLITAKDAADNANISISEFEKLLASN